MEILGMQVLLPVVVKYRKTTGDEHAVFCYIDQVTKKVILVDSEESVENELLIAIQQFVQAQHKRNILPPLPTEGFQRMRPETYET